MNSLDKKHLHHFWTRFRRVKPWYFVVLALISGVICVFALRANNLRMVELREAVYTADKDNGDTETALRNLREYVYGHMNTDLAGGAHAVYPPIQLKYTYERLVEEQNSKLKDANSELYNNAQIYCEQAIPTGFSGSNRLACIQTYLKEHGTSADVKSIPKNLYQFDFVSPFWSPDLAGWSMVATVLLLLVAAVLWLARNVIRHLLRSHK